MKATIIEKIGEFMNTKGNKAAKLMGKVSVKVQDLIKMYPPEYESPVKKQFYEQAAYYHRNQNGIVRISRWTFNSTRKAPLELTVNKLDIQVKQDFFKYDDFTENHKVWWVNFADETLFGYYGSDLFAQDEIQTFEHPLLGSTVEFLDRNKIPDLETRTETKKFVSPYLIENVPYWINVNVNPVLKDGSIGNLYGWNFSTSPFEVIKEGVKVIQEEKKNNILAMAAPSGGRGEYTESQINRLMETVMSSFGAASKIASLDKKTGCTVHTGNWGCGAFGNSKELMYLSQILGASLTGVDRLVFHGADLNVLEEAKRKFNEFALVSNETNMIDFLMKQKYSWRNGDEN